MLTDRELEDDSQPFNQLDNINHEDDLMNQAFSDDDQDDDNQIERVNPNIHPPIDRFMMQSIVNEEEESKIN